MRSKVKIAGRLKIELVGPDGEIKDQRLISNLVVTAGKAVIADRLMSVPTKAAVSHMAVGTGTTAAADGDTTLETELTRAALTTATAAAGVATYAASYPAGTGTGSLTEAGLFNANAAGDMLCRSVFPAIVKGASDGLTITWTVTIS